MSFSALNSSLVTIIVTFLDVRAHRRVGAVSRELLKTSQLERSWPLRLRVLGCVYGLHVEAKCDWHKAERLLEEAPPSCEADALRGLLKAIRAGWRFMDSSVLFDAALELTKSAAEQGNFLARLNKPTLEMKRDITKSAKVFSACSKQIRALLPELRARALADCGHSAWEYSIAVDADDGSKEAADEASKFMQRAVALGHAEAALLFPERKFMVGCILL